MIFLVALLIGIMVGFFWCLLLARPKYWYDKGYEDGLHAFKFRFDCEEDEDDGR